MKEKRTLSERAQHSVGKQSYLVVKTMDKEA